MKSQAEIGELIFSLLLIFGPARINNGRNCSGPRRPRVPSTPRQCRQRNCHHRIGIRK